MNRFPNFIFSYPSTQMLYDDEQYVYAIKSLFHHFFCLKYLLGIFTMFFWRVSSEAYGASHQKIFPKVYFVIQQWSMRDPQTTKSNCHVSKFQWIGSPTYWFQICSIWFRIIRMPIHRNNWSDTSRTKIDYIIHYDCESKEIQHNSLLYCYKNNSYCNIRDWYYIHNEYESNKWYLHNEKYEYCYSHPGEKVKQKLYQTDRNKWILLVLFQKSKLHLCIIKWDNADNYWNHFLIVSFGVIWWMLAFHEWL